MVGLMAAAFLILRPFLAALIWAAMIVVATWPLLLAAQARLWGRRWLAATVMTLALLLAFVLPLALALQTVAANVDHISGLAHDLGEVRLPDPPQAVQAIPLVGERLASAWRELASKGPAELRQWLAPYARDAGRWLVSKLGNVGRIAIDFLLTLLIAAILYAYGDTAAGWVRRFCRRLAGPYGEDVVHVAGQAIRGVALAVLLTAMIQAALAGIGLFVAGVPFAAALTALMFVLGMAQIGGLPVLACAVIWLYWRGDTGWATALLVWSVFVGTIDNVLRPFLIRKGADLPLLLIFAGVTGGLVAFGVVGIFVGPVVLAVAFRLLEAWIRMP
jgi:predicted PurR-regulated permease PerM